MSPSGGTTRYEGPELFDEASPRPTFKSDVYSVACVMYEVRPVILDLTNVFVTFVSKGLHWPPSL